MSRRTLTARNTATESENRIHDDVVAGRFGFRGGLVPGVSLVAYLVPAVLDELGEGWLGGGVLEVRFGAPVYEGEEVTASCEEGAVQLSTSRGVSTSGAAHLRPAGVLDRRPRTAEAPDHRPPASRETLAVGTPLVTVRHTADGQLMADHLAAIGDDPAWWLSQGVAQPGWMLRDANEVLVRTVRLGPWIHTGSRLRTLRPVTLGVELETRAEVVALEERNGHEIVELDVLTLAEGEPALLVHHTAIWRPRQVAEALPA